MNTILQKRIEEAANTTVQNLYDYAKQTRNPKVSAYSEGYLDAIDVQGDFLFREGANYALSNQWISVEEALPEFQQDVVVTNSEGDYWTAWRSNENCEHKDNNGFVNYGIGEITHWMAIPSLEGGGE